MRGLAADINMALNVCECVRVHMHDHTNVFELFLFGSLGFFYFG